MRPIPGQVVRVLYEDVSWEEGHVSGSEIREEPYVVLAVGVVVRTDTHFLSIAFEVHPGTEEYRAVSSIPWSYVREVQLLEPAFPSSLGVDTSGPGVRDPGAAVLASGLTDLSAS